MYGARSKFSRGKSTWAFSFDSCSEPRQVNRLRCRQRTGGNDCSLVFLTVLATLPQWSHEYIAEPDRISSRVCTAKHCWSVAQPPGPSPGSTASPASGEGRVFSFEKQTLGVGIDNWWYSQRNVQEGLLRSVCMTTSKAVDQVKSSSTK